MRARPNTPGQLASKPPSAIREKEKIMIHPLFRALAVPLAATLLVSLTACTTNTGTVADDKRAQGAVLGTLAGAAAGAAIDSNKRGRGALIGAAVGGLAGVGIGQYLEKQKKEIDQIPDANVQQQGEALMVAFPGDVLFDTGSSSLAPGAYSRLDQLAASLTRYPDTDVIVRGHTDGAGSETFNQTLSEQRADSVRRYLIGKGVAQARVTSVGFGESMPLATNSTPEGRQQNRRVEIELRPNQQMREQQGSTTR
jgi:outer membrane protein OmpA-like peptidoglycan-associated protein